MATRDRRAPFLADVLLRLDDVDATRLSLDPSRETARPLRAIATDLADDLAALGEPTAQVFALGMGALVRAIHDHFPDNLFADLDALASGLLDEAREQPDPAAHLRAAFEDLVALHARFGQRTAIRFRYVHDFLYGFDWAKWVGRGAAARASVHPFDRRYLRAMLTRGDELLALIRAGDSSYPPLDGPGARNPFRFSREPEDERALLIDLRQHELIPVRAWELRPAVRWNLPYAAERQRRAEALSLGR